MYEWYIWSHERFICPSVCTSGIRACIRSFIAPHAIDVVSDVRKRADGRVDVV